MVKTYFKILGIAFISQIYFFVVSFCLNSIDFFDNIEFLENLDILSTISVIYFILGFVVPIVLGVIFSIKWFETTKQKIIGFLLLPTNYTFAVFMIALYVAMCMFIEFLEKTLGNVFEEIQKFN